MTEPLLAVDNLRTYFSTEEGIVRAVDGISFSVQPGERRGVVGESGSGKSVTAMSIMGLIEPPAGEVVTGSIVFEGENLLSLNEAVDTRAKPGNTSPHQKPLGARRPPSATIAPHVGVGGRTPKPRNDSAASMMIAAPMMSVVWTMIGLIALGRMCRNTMRRSLAPAALAASTNSFSRSERNSARTILARPPHARRPIRTAMPIAPSVTHDGKNSMSGSTRPTTMATGSSGRPRTRSVKRISDWSTPPG